MNPRSITLWTAFGLGALLLFSCTKTPDTDPHLSEEDPSLFWTIVENEKDWWEELKIGRVIDGKVAWLLMDKAPEEQSIYRADFVQLAGTSSSFLQVYGESHMGNGSFYLYKIDGDTVKQVLKTAALDLNQENASSEGDPTMACSSLLKDGTLQPDYEDWNGDGFDDLVLRGTQMTFCSPSGGSLADVMSSSPDETHLIQKSFAWDAVTESFVQAD